MNLSYQEKSIWGSLLAMLLVFGYYFAGLFSGPAERGGEKLGNLIGTVVLFTLIEIVYHVAISLKWKNEAKDERDLQIEGKAFRNAYILLTSGAFVSMVSVVVQRHFYGPPPSFMNSPYRTVDVILFFVVAAEGVKFATQLFYYRRGL